MADNLAGIVEIAAKKLRSLGCSSPSKPVLRELLEVSFLASLQTEEGRFLRASITYADPSAPDDDPPRRRRADYPSFTRLGNSIPLTASNLVKLARAVDSWTGSIAVHGKRPRNITAWGIVDQVVHTNTHLYRETDRGYERPGILTITIDNVAELSIYHRNLFLAGLRRDRVLRSEADMLRSSAVRAKILPFLRPFAERIALALDLAAFNDEVASGLCAAWASAVSRICIGIRRAGTGGALLITPPRKTNKIEIKNLFPYKRLSHSMIIGVLDQLYASIVFHDMMSRSKFEFQHFAEKSNADTDKEDRAQELTAAIKLVSSLATVDGLVQLSPTLEVVGFGAKITASKNTGDVFSARDLLRNAHSPRRCETSRFGTRHGSMLRYCAGDPDAIGIVVSQDGNVRVIINSDAKVWLCDDVLLLAHDQDISGWIRYRSEYRKNKVTDKAVLLGYTKMPKTVDALMRVRRPQPGLPK